jgi:DNA-binding FadR family transcriptional regulator
MDYLLMAVTNINLSEQVTNELGKAIISEKYQAGSNLPTEAQLCEKYQVSRTAIREAVKMLSAKGLISSKPRQGIRVEPSENWNLYDIKVLNWMLNSSPSLFVLKEFLQVRMAIEPQAAALAARNGDKELILLIKDALDEMDSTAIIDEASMYDSDLAFHTAILQASGNRFFAQLKEFIRTALAVSIQHTTQAKGNRVGIVEEHAKVYNAIASGDSESAKNFMEYLIHEAMVFIDKEIAKVSQ